MKTRTGIDWRRKMEVTKTSHKLALLPWACKRFKKQFPWYYLKREIVMISNYNPNIWVVEADHKSTRKPHQFEFDLTKSWETKQLITIGDKNETRNLRNRNRKTGNSYDTKQYGSVE